MAIRKEIPVIIHSRNYRDLNPTDGIADVVEWTQPERFKNALKVYLIMLMVNCIGAAMPPFHLIEAVGLFFLCWYLTLDKYSQVQFIDGGKGICPKCGGEFPFERSKYNTRLTDKCVTCFDDLEILLKV